MRRRLFRMVYRCLLRRSHSYLAQRVTVNPVNIVFVAAIFVIGCYLAYRDEGLTSDLWFAMSLASIFVAVFTWAYLRFFRALNAVRIFVTRYGIVYRDRTQILRLPRHSLVSIERMPSGMLGKWRVGSTNGTFEFDGRLVSAGHLTRLIDAWLVVGKWEIG